MATSVTPSEGGPTLSTDEQGREIRLWRVYLLTDVQGKKRYVGTTSWSLSNRMSTHRTNMRRHARGVPTCCPTFYEAMVMSGTTFDGWTISQLDECWSTRPTATRLEHYWEQKLRAEGHPLLNVPRGKRLSKSFAERMQKAKERSRAEAIEQCLKEDK